MGEGWVEGGPREDLGCDTARERTQEDRSGDRDTSYQHINILRNVCN